MSPVIAPATAPVAVRRRVQGDDRLGRRDVGDQRSNHTGPQRPQDRPDLALTGGHGNRGRHPSEASGIERDHSIAQVRADKPAVEVERRDEDLADGIRGFEFALDRLADHATRSRPDRRSRTARRRGGPTDRRSRGSPACATRAVARGGVVDETRGHEPSHLAAERVTDPAIRLAFLAGRPEAAAQRNDREGDRGGAVLERVGGRRHEGAVPDPRPSRPVGRRPAAPPRRDGRPSVASGRRARRWSARGGRHRDRIVDAETSPAGLSAVVRVDDPDLDDAFRPCPLQQPRDLRPGDAEQVAIAFCVSPSS